MINFTTSEVDNIELLPCVLHSVSASISASGRNFDASLCPISTPKSIDYSGTSKSVSSHTKEDRNQSQTLKSSTTVRGSVGSTDPQPAIVNPKVFTLLLTPRLM